MNDVLQDFSGSTERSSLNPTYLGKFFKSSFIPLKNLYWEHLSDKGVCFGGLKVNYFVEDLEYPEPFS